MGSLLARVHVYKAKVTLCALLVGASVTCDADNSSVFMYDYLCVMQLNHTHIDKHHLAPLLGAPNVSLWLARSLTCALIVSVLRTLKTRSRTRSHDGQAQAKQVVGNETQRHKQTNKQRII